MNARLNVITYAVLGAGLAGTWALMAGAVSPDGETRATALLRHLWVALPYVVTALTAHWLGRTPARRLVVLAGAACIALAGVGVLLDELVLRPAPRASVTIVLLPAYQLVLAVAVLLVVSVLTLRRTAPPPARG